MEEKFKKICKISLLVFIILLVVMLAWVGIVNKNDGEISGPIALLFVISTIELLVCVLIAFVLCVVKGVRTEGFSFIIHMLLEVVLVTVVYVVIMHFMDKEIKILESVGSIAGIAWGSKVIDYVMEKPKSE